MKILAFSGSIRKDSFNKKLITCAASLSDQITLIDLADYPLPIYNGDIESQDGLPENAKKLKELFISHDSLLIASPENNSSYSALLKNTIDWVSRSSPNEPPLSCFKNKIASIMSASPSFLGGLRGLAALRLLLENLGTIVLPTQLTISKADQKFSPSGELTDEKKRTALQSLITDHIAFLEKISK